jgi:hypothetical protein
MKLCICFFHECRPEFVVGVGMVVSKLSICRGKKIIHHHIHPLPILPEPEINVTYKKHMLTLPT